MRFYFTGSAVLVALVMVSRAAQAHGGELRMPEETPKAPAGTDGAAAEAVLRDVEAKVGSDAGLASVASDAVKASKRALERAHGARSAADSTHARMLDGVALEWAETARDLVRAAVVERESFAVNQVANELKTKIERERTLLEETQARRGRLAAELARLQAEAAEATKQARNIEAERLRGAQKGGKPDRPPVEKHKSAGGAGGD